MSSLDVSLNTNNLWCDGTVSTNTFADSGNLSDGQSLGLGDAARSVARGLSGGLRGIGKISESIGDSFIQAGNVLSGISTAQTNYLRMCYNSPWGWGWGCCGIGIMGYPMYFGGLENFGGGGAFGDYSYGGQGAYRNEALDTLARLPRVDNVEYREDNSLIPINNNHTMKTTFDMLNGVINPAEYNPDGSPKTSSPGAAGTTNSNEKHIETVDAATGRINTPTWYKKIVAKVDKKSELNPAEKKLKDNYETIMRKYSPYHLDRNNDYELDENGQPVPSDFYDELVNVKNMLIGKRRDELERYFKSCSPEKLAALELHYGAMPFSEGKTLREAIKEASLCTGFGWTNWNTDRCGRIFDMFDKAATVCPQNMAIALKQAITNHKLGGWDIFGVDDSRVAKLIKMMSDDKLFRSATETEYMKYGSCLRNDLGDKFFLSDEVEKLQNKYL